MTTISCEHAIYTSVVTKKVTGYQFIAWSPGVSQEDLKIIQSYTTFLRTLPYDSHFTSSTRFYSMGAKRYCLTMMKNAGKDSAGRPNRIYSHNFVLTEQQLELMRFNPFSVDEKALMFDDELRGTIEPVEVKLSEETMILDPILQLMDPTDITSFLNAYFSPHKSIVIETSEDRDMRELLESLVSLVPVSARKNLSFSSYSMGPGNRNFKITVIPEKIKLYSSSTIPENFVVIDLVNHKSRAVREEKTASFSEFLMECVVTNDISTLSSLLDSTNRGPETLYADLGRWTNYWREYRNIMSVPRREQALHHYRLGKGIADLYPQEAMDRLKASFALFMEMGQPEQLADVSLTSIELAIKGKDKETAKQMFLNAAWFLWRNQHLETLKRFLNLSLRYAELVASFQKFASEHLTKIAPDLLTGGLFMPYLQIENIAIEYFKRSKRKDHHLYGHNLAMGLGEYLSKGRVNYEITRKFLLHAEEILDSFDDYTKMQNYEKLKGIYNRKGDNKGYYRVLWRLGMAYVKQRRVQGLPNLTEALSYIELEGKLKVETMRVVTWMTQQKKQFKQNPQLFLAATPFFQTLLKKDLSQREKTSSLEIMIENHNNYIGSFHHGPEIRKALLTNLQAILEHIPKGEGRQETSAEEKEFSRKARKIKGKMIKSMIDAYVKIIKKTLSKDAESARGLIAEARDFFVNAPTVGHTPTRILELEMLIEEGR